MNRTLRFCLGRGLAFVVLMVLMIGAVAWAIMSLWNWLLPELLHAPTINFAQSVGLLVLCRLLLGHPFGHRCPARRFSRRDTHERLRERWQQLPDAERAKLREHMRRWWRC